MLSLVTRHISQLFCDSKNTKKIINYKLRIESFLCFNVLIR